MARLFIKHQPIDCAVQLGFKAPHVFMVRRKVLTDAGMKMDEYLQFCKYICFVHESAAWAALSMHGHHDTKLVRVLCAKMEDQPCVQEMLLADMILS